MYQGTRRLDFWTCLWETVVHSRHCPAFGELKALEVGTNIGRGTKGVATSVIRDWVLFLFPFEKKSLSTLLPGLL